MKKVLACGLLSTTILFTSCIGSFSAFNGLRDWNESVTDSKFGNELIFIALWVFPVYGLAALADLVVFNAIEFWDGTNPIAMNEGDSETKTIVNKGNTYKITATKDRFNVVVTAGERKGEATDLVYLANDKSWNVEKENGKLQKLSSLKKGLLMAHLPNGETVSVPQGLNRLATLDYLESNLEAYNECKYAELVIE